MTNKSVYVILLAWNHIEDTQEALLSFQQDEYLNKNIVLVSNLPTSSIKRLVINSTQLGAYSIGNGSSPISRSGRLKSVILTVGGNFRQ